MTTADTIDIDPDPDTTTPSTIEERASEILSVCLSVATYWGVAWIVRFAWHALRGVVR